ncbi:hypothetical protein CLOM_g1286 [Closterium sp. NIES-68]|nr:hypothetical protein CLOM_g1286 [Closterium sp. NIES-68]
MAPRSISLLAFLGLLALAHAQKAPAKNPPGNPMDQSWDWEGAASKQTDAFGEGAPVNEIDDSWDWFLPRFQSTDAFGEGEPIHEIDDSWDFGEPSSDAFGEGEPVHETDESWDFGESSGNSFGEGGPVHETDEKWGFDDGAAGDSFGDGEPLHETDDAWAIGVTTVNDEFGEGEPRSQLGSSQCTKSSLPGYSCSVELKGKDYILHWTVGINSVSYAAEVATTGWVALGWSKDGKMAGSDAAIGNLPPGIVTDDSENGNVATIGSFYIGGKSKAEIVPNPRLGLALTAVTSRDGKTIVEFEREMASGRVPLFLSSPAHIIWAYSDSNSQELKFHGANRGSADVAYNNGTTTITTTPAPSAYGNSASFIAHGFFMAFAFAIIMPSAIIIARMFLAADQISDPLLRSTTGDANGLAAGLTASLSEQDEARRAFWFKAHMFLQILAVLFVFIGGVVALVTSGSRGLDYLHGQFGLAIFIIVLVLPIGGFVKPKRNSGYRMFWRFGHWFVGIVAVVMGWVNVFLGLDRYTTMFSGSQKAYLIIIGVAISSFGLFYVALLLRDYLFPPKPEVDQFGAKASAGAPATGPGHV